VGGDFFAETLALAFFLAVGMSRLRKASRWLLQQHE
jgi:hypothetical protein